MTCTVCGGEVLWRGPWDRMYRKCQRCGVEGGTVVEDDGGAGICRECGRDLETDDAEGICRKCDLMLYGAQES